MSDREVLYQAPFLRVEYGPHYSSEIQGDLVHFIDPGSSGSSQALTHSEATDLAVAILAKTQPLLLAAARGFGRMPKA